MKCKIGTMVYTTKGDRIKGAFGIGKVVKFTSWAGIPAASVKTPDGKIHRNCLLRNLVRK